LAGLSTLVSAGSELQLPNNEIVPKSTPASRKQRKRREAGGPTETDIGIGKALGKVLARSIGITQRNALRPKTTATKRNSGNGGTRIGVSPRNFYKAELKP
jgi:hypothetical protein